MTLNVTQKLIKGHLAEGELRPGAEIGLKIDQTLTQDATGTMVMLEFEAMRVPRVRTELSAQYVDHNLLQKTTRTRMTTCSCGARAGSLGSGSADRETASATSSTWNDLVSLEKPYWGRTAIRRRRVPLGCWRLAPAAWTWPGHGWPAVPRANAAVWGVRLTGELPPWVSAKDVILELLRRHDVDGGVGKVIEYYGRGLDQP